MLLLSIVCAALTTTAKIDLFSKGLAAASLIDKTRKKGE